MKDVFAAFWGWLKKIFTRNLGMKIGALAFAFLLWSFVITDTNPMREKVFRDIPVTFTNAESLKERNLTTSQPLSELLPTATVTVQARAQNLQYVTDSIINVTVDLSPVTDVGEYTLRLQGATTTTIGTIVKIQPETITLSVEEIVTRDVPVEVQVVGDKQDDLYYGAPVISSSTVQATGSRSNLQDVAKAVCYVDIDDVDSSIKASYPVTFLDSADREIPSDRFSGIPSAIVEVPIYPQKEVPVDANAILAGISGIPEGYEIQSITLSPETVQVAGSQEVIDRISSIELEPLSLENRTGEVVLSAEVDAPDGVIAVTPAEVEVHLSVVQPQGSATYDAMDVGIKNLGDGLEASLEPASIDITATGAQEALDDIHASDILPFVDLAGLSEGTHTVQVKFENLPDLRVTLAPSQTEVTVTIT